MILLLIYLIPLQALSDKKNVQETSIENRLQELDKDNFSSPKEILIELNQLIVVIEENKLLDSLIVATSLKVEALVLLEQYKKAKQLIFKYKSLAEKRGKSDAVIDFEVSLLNILDINGVTNELISLRKTLLEKAKIESDKSIAASIYMAVGLSEYTEGNYRIALMHYHKSYELHQLSNSSEGMSDVLNAFANVYLDFNDTEKAKEYYIEALAIDRKQNNKFAESIVLYNLAQVYEINDQYKKAKHTLDEALTISVAIDDDVGVILVKLSLANIYIKEKKWSEALNYYHGVFHHFENTGDYKNYFDALIGISAAHIGLNELMAAEASLDRAKAILTQLNNEAANVRYTLLSASLAQKSGHYDIAFDLQSDYIQKVGKIYRKQREENTQKYRVLFDTKLVQDKNKKLSTESELKSLKILQQSQQQRYWFLIFGFSVVIILMTIYMLWKQIQHRNRFQSMALRDPLTQAPNRRAILQYAEERFNEAKCTGMELSFAVIDIDLFKSINDEFGHEVGDEILKEFALSCKAILRKQDRYGRIGGEEWLIVFSDTNRDHIKSIFHRLYQELSVRTSSILPKNKAVTFSMGVSQFKNNTDVGSLIRSADVCMYDAKSAGRNQIKFES
jgi:diguanylate cyclase (GGDEF)-like protein